MSLDSLLKNITNKTRMHQFIDDLPDDSQGVLAVSTGECGPISIFTYGPVSNRDVLWLTEHIRSSIVRNVEDSI